MRMDYSERECAWKTGATSAVPWLHKRCAFVSERQCAWMSVMLGATLHTGGRQRLRNRKGMRVDYERQHRQCHCSLRPAAMLDMTLCRRPIREKYHTTPLQLIKAYWR